jgi:hypothetical protein
MLALAVFVFVAGVAAFVFAATRLTDAGMPSHERVMLMLARPDGATILSDDSGCPIDAAWRPPCRTAEFSVDRPYTQVVDELQARFIAAGWSAGIEGHNYSLHVMDEWHERCIVFYPSDRMGESAAVVGAIFDRCGVR